MPLIGAEAYAQAVALAVFMAGLAAGALLARRRADRGRPLRDYALLELAIAGYALAIPLLLAAAGAGYLALARLLFQHDAARLAIRFALTILIVAPPAILMGATLPLLAGALARQAPGQLRRRVSALYAANCAGAVLGTAVAGFVALPLLGIWGALAIAVLANLAAAALVAPVARREPARAPPPPSRRAPPIELPSRAGSGVVASDRRPRSPPTRTAGPVALRRPLRSAACAPWGTRCCSCGWWGWSMGSSGYAFSVMLIGFIGGIALGSALLGRLRHALVAGHPRDHPARRRGGVRGRDAAAGPAALPDRRAPRAAAGRARRLRAAPARLGPALPGGAPAAHGAARLRLPPGRRSARPAPRAAPAPASAPPTPSAPRATWPACSSAACCCSAAPRAGAWPRRALGAPARRGSRCCSPSPAVNPAPPVRPGGLARGAPAVALSAHRRRRRPLPPARHAAGRRPSRWCPTTSCCAKARCPRPAPPSAPATPPAASPPGNAATC